MQKGIRLLSLVLVLFIFNSCGYNKMVSLDQEVQTAWSQVLNVYDNRVNLAPQLIAEFKKADILSSSELAKLEKAAKKAKDGLAEGSLKMDEAGIKDLRESQEDLSEGLKGIYVRSREDQRASEFSKAIQNSGGKIESAISSLLQTETKIKAERKRYNEKVREYNTYIKQMPQSASSGMMGFHEAPYFEIK